MATSRSACDMSAHAARADIGNTTRQFLEKEVSERLPPTSHIASALLSRLTAGRQRRKLTATSTAQWDRNLVPLKVSPKRSFCGFGWRLLGNSRLSCHYSEAGD